MSVAPVAAPTPVDEVTAATIEPMTTAEMAATNKATMPAPNLYDVVRLVGSSSHGRWGNDRSICSGHKRKKAAGNHASSQHTLHHWVTSSWARVFTTPALVNDAIRGSRSQELSATQH